MAICWCGSMPTHTPYARAWHMSNPNIGHGLQNYEPVTAFHWRVPLIVGGCQERLTCFIAKKICLLALSGQDAIKQTCHLSPVLPLVWLYLSTVESQLWIFPEFRILPHTWPKFCKNGSWVLLSLLLKYICWNHLQSHLPLHICSKYKTPKNLLTKGCKLNRLKAIESCFAK